MRFSSSDLADLPGIRDSLLATLRSSPFRLARTWRHAIIVQTPEGRTVLHRAAFADRLRSDGLDEAAHEVMARRVGDGEVLIYVLIDNEHAAGVCFMVAQLRG